MFRKTTIFAALVTAAVALAIPTAAAADWTDSKVKITKPVSIAFVGGISWTSATGGISCGEAKMELTLEPGTKGKVDAYAPVVASCKGTGGLGGCTVTSAVTSFLPWGVHTTGTTIEITTSRIVTTLHGGFCPFHELEVAGAITATPDNAEAMTTVTLSSVATSGSGGTHKPAGVEVYNGTTFVTITTVAMGGTMNVAPAGTYGIK